MSSSALITYSDVTRKGLQYRATIKYTTNMHVGSIVLKWDPIAYWLIRLFHGEPYFKKLVRDRVDRLRYEIGSGAIP